MTSSIFSTIVALIYSLTSTVQSILDCNYVAFPKWCVIDCTEATLSAPVDICWNAYDFDSGAKSANKFSCDNDAIVISIWNNSNDCSDIIAPTIITDVSSQEYNCDSANQCSYSITETYLVPESTTCYDGVTPSDITPDQSLMVTDHCWAYIHTDYKFSILQSQCDDSGTSAYTQYSDEYCGQQAFTNEMSADGICTPYGTNNIFRRDCIPTQAPSTAPTTTAPITTAPIASTSAAATSKSTTFYTDSSSINTEIYIISINITIEFNITKAVLMQVTLTIEQYISTLSIDIDPTIDSVIAEDIIIVRLYATENEVQHVNKEELIQLIETDLSEFDVYDNDAKETSNEFEQAALILMVVLAIFTLIAAIDGKKLRPNDYFQIGSLVAASLQILDCVSDILFAVRITKHRQFPSQSFVLILFILSIVFLLIPVLVSIFQLQSMIHKYWNKNDQMRAWLRDHMYLLFMLSFWCGSSFSAVQLCSSNAFDLNLFSMPLSKPDKSHFQYKRVYSVVLLENAPQVIIALCFVLISSDSRNNNDIAYISMAFSSISILMMMISSQATKQLLETEDHSMITMHVTGTIDGNNVKVCKKQTNQIRDSMSILLGVDHALLEIPKPQQIQNGLRVQIIILVNYSTIIELQIEKKIFDQNINDEISEFIAKYWNLEKEPTVTIVKFEQNQPKQTHVEIVTAKTNMDETVHLSGLSQEIKDKSY